MKALMVLRVGLLSFCLQSTMIFPVQAQSTITVNSVSELVSAVNQANSGGVSTIIITDGTYQLTDMLFITAMNLTIKSQSGDRTRVIVRGQGMWGTVTHIFNVAGPGFQVQDMTLRDVSQHAVQLQLDTDNVAIRNCHILDTGEQMVKIPYLQGDPRQCDNGIVEDCRFEYSAGIGPQYYIGGVDGHYTRHWIIRDNTFIGIRSPDDTAAEHAIHFWSNAEDTLVERNLIINCDRGIGFGLGDRGHIRGIIRNNMIYHDSTEGNADVGIGIESSPGTRIYNNTIIFLNSYPNAIEYRFPVTTNVYIANNLTNRVITSRDGATATETHNLQTANTAWFVNPADGDLHLRQQIASVVDQGISVDGLNDDFDRQERPHGAGIDIGADEYYLPETPALTTMGCIILFTCFASLISLYQAQDRVVPIHPDGEQRAENRPHCVCVTCLHRFDRRSGYQLH